MMTISFEADSCVAAYLPKECNAPVGHVIVIGKVAKDAETFAGSYKKGDVVRHCHGLMPLVNAQEIIDRVSERNFDMAQFWYNCGPENP